MKKNELIKKLSEVNLLILDTTLCNSEILHDKLMPLLIVYFHPECEFCSYEITELLKHKKNIDSIQLLFVTFASIEETKDYLLQYPIDQFTHVTIALDLKGEFANTFDVKSPPMIFIYDKNKKLIKKHKGIMAFKRLEKYLKQSY